MEPHEQESDYQGYFRCADGAPGGMVLLLCCAILFFYGSFFCKKGIGKVQICNFIFLIPAVASLGLWGNSAAVKDEDAEAAWKVVSLGEP